MFHSIGHFRLSRIQARLEKAMRDTYEYFDFVDSVWWESFFNNQSDISSRSRNEDIMLETPLIWPQNMPNEHEEINIV